MHYSLSDSSFFFLQLPLTLYFFAPWKSLIISPVSQYFKCLKTMIQSCLSVFYFLNIPHSCICFFYELGVYYPLTSGCHYFCVWFLNGSSASSLSSLDSILIGYLLPQAKIRLGITQQFFIIYLFIWENAIRNALRKSHIQNHKLC